MAKVTFRRFEGEEEVPAIEEEILKVLEEEYYKGLWKDVEMFSSIQLTGGRPTTIPSAVDNATRNALNHFALAYCKTRDSIDVTNAKWHILVARSHIQALCTRAVIKDIDDMAFYLRRQHTMLDVADEQNITTYRKESRRINLQIRNRNFLPGEWDYAVETVKSQNLLLNNCMLMYKKLAKIMTGGDTDEPPDFRDIRKKNRRTRVGMHLWTFWFAIGGFAFLFWAILALVARFYL